MKRRVLVCVCALGLLAGLRVDARQQPPAAPATQPAPQAAQDEFVPGTVLPPADQMPAGPLVLGASGFIWGVVRGSVARRRRAVAGVQRVAS